MGMGGVLKEEREGLSERGGGGFGVVAEPPAGVRKGLKLQYSVQPACSLQPAHPSVEQCDSGGWRSRWWRSATPKTSSEIPPAGPESGSPDALTAAHYRRAAVNIPQSSPRNCIRICPMADVPNAHLSCWRHSQRAEKMGSPLLPLECGFRGLTTLSMAIFASEEVT